MAALGPQPESEQRPAAFSLARLSTAFARLLGPAADQRAGEAPATVTPKMIVEAVLFVGSPAGRGSTAAEIAQPIRDLAAEEVEQIIAELNGAYADEGTSYEIVQSGGRYRMQLRPHFEQLSNHVHGRDRPRRISSAALEVLSMVAYRPGMQADAINRLRGTRSNELLANLVRWQLLRVEYGRAKASLSEGAADSNEASPGRATYFTTERFHRLLGIGSLEDLPQPGVWDDADATGSAGAGAA